MSDEAQKKKIVVPWWPGPIGDEWDSPAYNDFWSPVEQAINQKILDAKAEGKEVELVAPKNTSRYTQKLGLWAPFAARLIFAFVFLHSAYYKIPGTESFAGQVGVADSVGIPFPAIAVMLAFLLEVAASAMLILGWHTRLAAASLIGFLILIAAFFVRDFSDQMQLTIFFSCLELVAGLLYVAVYGAEHIALRKDN